jgi:hypothetical protein
MGRQRALVVQKVTAKPRVNFIKSPYDDNFRAETCPAATAACRMKSHLVTGDLVLTGKTLGAFTCTSYQVTKSTWITSWLPSTALTPVAPMASPKISDWLGTWHHSCGGVEITRGDGDKLRIEGVMLILAGQETRNGYFKADVTPQNYTIAHADEYADGCRVRMQRVGPLLLVEDNNSCGGSGVTFNGLYRRK